MHTLESELRVVLVLGQDYSHHLEQWLEKAFSLHPGVFSNHLCAIHQAAHWHKGDILTGSLRTWKVQSRSDASCSFAGNRKAGQPLALSLLGRPRQRLSKSKQGIIDASKNAVAASLKTYISEGRLYCAMHIFLPASELSNSGIDGLGVSAGCGLHLNHAIHAGGKEKGLANVWQELSDAENLLAVAPDDEVLAEIFALQAELLQQVAVNRAKTASLLQLALKDVPNQLRAATQKQLGVDVAKAWIAVSIHYLSMLIMHPYRPFQRCCIIDLK